MEGVCLYLPLILLMRSGDVETNPGPNPTDSVEWEGELLQLAERIQPAKYMRIGNSLGVRHAQLQTIMKEQLNNNTNALMAVFMIWDNKTLPGINKRDVLADKLKESGFLELSDKIRNGNLDANLTASRNKEVGINVMKYMVGGLNERTGLLVDVALECNHPEAVAVVHQKVHPTIQEFETYKMTYHTVAAYKSIGIDAVNMAIEGDFHQSSAHDIAGIVCSSSSLQVLDVWAHLHDDFFTILWEQAARIQAQTVSLTDFGSLEDGSWRVLSHLISQKLAETLASMPYLYRLKLVGVHVHEVFYSVLKEKATILKIQELTLSSCRRDPVFSHIAYGRERVQSLTSTANDDLAEALSSMPELTELTLDLVLPNTLFEKIIEQIESCESCFPQVARDNFVFNGERQRNMQMFLNTLKQYESEERNWVSQK